MRIRLFATLLVVTTVGAACGDSSSGPVTGPAYEVSGYVHAGPTCPVMQDPPDPACDDRGVAAVLLVVDELGAEVATVRTSSDGAFSLKVPPGRYSVVPQPVEGLLGTAEPLSFEVVAEPVTDLDLAYDTGIR
ncbi:MAG: hypothetical protein V3R84_02390 [Acidimicrobiia bacterium]